MRQSLPLGPYSRTMPRTVWWSQEMGVFLPSDVTLYTVRWVWLKPRGESQNRFEGGGTRANVKPFSCSCIPLVATRLLRVTELTDRP